MSEIAPVDAIWNSLPSKRELQARLDRLSLSADAKVLMGQLLETTADVAGRIIEVGRSILAFVLELQRRYPATFLGAIVGVTVTMLMGSIPILGVILGPLVGKLLAAFLITSGALADMRNSAIERQIELFTAKLDAVIVRG
jgi:hypothetical protein